MIILLCLLVTAMAAVATFAVGNGKRHWEIGDRKLIKTRLAVTSWRYAVVVEFGVGWRGLWRPRSAEPTTPDAICGLADIWHCGSGGWWRHAGPFLVRIGEKDTIRGLTDCSPPPQVDLSEQVDSDPASTRIRIMFQPWMDAPWEAEARYVVVITQLPQARRLFVAVGMISAAYPLFVFIRGPLRRRRRRRRGLCLTCGYNLTGNTSGRCPECGTLLQSV